MKATFWEAWKFYSTVIGTNVDRGLIAVVSSCSNDIEIIGFFSSCLGECGVSGFENVNNTAGQSLTNGTEVGQKDFPWQCYLSSQNGKPFCGCSILTHKLIMTAAHCIEGKRPADIFVSVGSSPYTAYPNLLPITNFTLHPSYNTANQWDFDFSIVELMSNLTFTEAISP